jgi:hypothetical protein
LILSVVHVVPFLYQPLEENGPEALKFIYYHDPGMGVSYDSAVKVYFILRETSIPERPPSQF